MIASFDFSFCKAEIYKDYILTIMTKGMTVIPKYNELLMMVADQYYKTNPLCICQTQLEKSLFNKEYLIQDYFLQD